MLNFIKEHRFYLSLALLILIPVLTLNTSSKAPADFNFLDRTLVFFTSPIQSAITTTIDFSARTLQNYIFVIHARSDLNAMTAENRRLLNTIHKYKEMEQENVRLRALLEFQGKIEDKTLTAEVTAKDVSTEFRSIRLNKGSNAGIQKGMAVVTHEGIVGRILRTTAHYSDVITILDNLSSVDSIIQRTRAKGMLEGATDYSCFLKYVLRTEDVETGDTVISSGLDGIYPKGLALGTVIKVAKRSFGVTQEVEVKPSVDFTKLEEVFVVLKPDVHVNL